MIGWVKQEWCKKKKKKIELVEKRYNHSKDGRMSGSNRLRWRRENVKMEEDVEEEKSLKREKRGMGDESRWGSDVETEVNRGCRTLLWAPANK